MFQRFSRSFTLMKASLAVLRQDKELLVFPLISSIAAMLVGASFILPLVLSPGALEQLGASEEPNPLFVVWAFAFYLTQYFVIFFFNSALVGAALIRLDGGDPTVADGFRIALSRVGRILGYAAIAATVGLILRMIEERAGFIGKWIAALLGAAWTVTTFMAVPILVTRDVGPIGAVKESALLLKNTWGENIIGNGGLGLAFALVYMTVMFAGIALGVLVAPTKNVVLILTVAGAVVVALVLIALMHAALSGIYSAALYRYATSQQGSGGFDGDVLGQAFRAK